jgi:hypothetical protein
MQSLSRRAGAGLLFGLCFLMSGRLLAADRLESDPPKLLFAETPAILVLIDGDPVYRPIEDSDYERLINTKAFIVRDTAGIHYLKILDGWMESYMLRGNWTVSGVAPRGVEPAVAQALAAKTVDLLDRLPSGRPDATPILNDDTAPTIVVSTEPAELIVTDGPPRFAAVNGTKLQYVENTTANVFKEPTDDEFYVLTAGRWFRAWTFDGPWELVPRADLPSDIAAIPDNSPLLTRRHRPSR